MLADNRLERAEKQFVQQLALELKIRPDVADSLLRALLIKNSV